MKRVYKSPATPERLRSYVKAFPDETWEHFRRRNRRGYREVAASAGSARFMRVL